MSLWEVEGSLCANYPLQLGFTSELSSGCVNTHSSCSIALVKSFYPFQVIVPGYVFSSDENSLTYRADFLYCGLVNVLVCLLQGWYQFSGKFCEFGLVYWQSVPNTLQKMDHFHWDNSWTSPSTNHSLTAEYNMYRWRRDICILGWNRNIWGDSLFKSAF